MIQRRRFPIWFWTIVLSTVLVLGAISWRPEWLILVTPGLRVTSAYCSRWKAVVGERGVLEIADDAKAILRDSKPIEESGNLANWRTSEGDFWIPKGSEATLALLIAQQRARIYGAIHSGDVIIDCGAHVGTFARAALKAGAARVIAVEPSPDALTCLRRNLGPEIDAGRVTVVPKGIWNTEGELTFYQNGNGDAADSFLNHDATSKPVVVPVTTLDRIAEDLQLQKLDMVKADVKGATERALQGGQSVTRRLHPRFALATEEPPEDPSRLTSLVTRLFPQYKATCGNCFVLEGEIRTDVMFYQ